MWVCAAATSALPPPQVAAAPALPPPQVAALSSSPAPSAPSSPGSGERPARSRASSRRSSTPRRRAVVVAAPPPPVVVATPQVVDLASPSSDEEEAAAPSSEVPSLSLPSAPVSGTVVVHVLGPGGSPVIGLETDIDMALRRSPGAAGADFDFGGSKILVLSSQMRPGAVYDQGTGFVLTDYALRNPSAWVPIVFNEVFFVSAHRFSMATLRACCGGGHFAGCRDNSAIVVGRVITPAAANNVVAIVGIAEGPARRAPGRPTTSTSTRGKTNGLVSLGLREAQASPRASPRRRHPGYRQIISSPSPSHEEY
ncbi:hypothetical protein JL722_6469 [Aureococcus anophagefferens]|nr:hypothetical protein JL722_6469 [Aureococcus anophagefferens]